MQTGILIMAAGASRRMGQPKQLMHFGKKTLLRHAVEVALASQAAAVSVVLGFAEAAIREDLTGLPVALVVNPDWEHGMGTTIRAGVETFLNQPEISSVILTVADSPGLNAGNYNALIVAHRASGLPIVASQYSDSVGVPVLFARSFFDALMNLPAAQGCKNLILTNAEKAMRILCPEAIFDIDTPDDYQRLIHSA